MPRILPDDSPSGNVAREVVQAEKATPTPTVRDLLRSMSLSAPTRLKLGTTPAVVAAPQEASSEASSPKEVPVSPPAPGPSGGLAKKAAQPLPPVPLVPPTVPAPSGESLTKLTEKIQSLEDFLVNSLPRLVEGLVQDATTKILAGLDKWGELVQAQKELEGLLHRLEAAWQTLDTKVSALSSTSAAAAASAPAAAPATPAATSTSAASPTPAAAPTSSAAPAEPPKKRGRPRKVKDEEKEEEVMEQTLPAAPVFPETSPEDFEEEGEEFSTLRVEDVPGLAEKIPQFVNACIAAGFLTGSEASYGLAQQVQHHGYDLPAEAVYQYLWEHGLMDEKGMLRRTA
jgi:hypothetical protein